MARATRQREASYGELAQTFRSVGCGRDESDQPLAFLHALSAAAEPAITEIFKIHEGAPPWKCAGGLGLELLWESQPLERYRKHKTMQRSRKEMRIQKPQETTWRG